MNLVATEEQNVPLVKFGLVTDVQYCECPPQNNRYYSSSALRLKMAIDDFNREDLDFVVNLGDLIDRNFSSYDVVVPILEGSVHQVYNLKGNHDYNVERGEIKKVESRIGAEAPWYSFSKRNLRFIFLDSNDNATYSPKSSGRKQAARMIESLSEAGKPNALDYNGGIGSRQIEWLKGELNRSVEKGEKVILFSHHPAFPETSFSMLNADEMLNIVKGYDNIIAWFSGHMHNGNYGNFNLIHFYTARAMVETEELTAYAVVEVYRNKIWIKGRGRERSLILAY